jgi:uncharacterized protein
MELVFEWDERKADQNRKSHKVSFEEAKTVFNDPLLITFPDEFHSDYEERLLSIGTSAHAKVLLVFHTEQEQEDDSILIRLISARKAMASERNAYEEERT